MAIKSAKTGDKRKATETVEKKTVKAPVKKEGPDSTRKLFKNDDASDDDSDDGSGLTDDEDGGASLPAKKKVKQAKETVNTEEEGESENKAERSKFGFLRPSCCSILTKASRNLKRIPHQAEATR